MGLPEEGGASRVISPQPSTLTGTRDSHGGCVNRAHTRPPDLARFHQPLCCLMASESFGCHDISRHRLGASARWESCCFGLPEGAGPVTVVAAVVVWRHCTRGGGYWTRVGCTLGRWGPRAVRTTLVQWIPTLVEQARLEAEPASGHSLQAPAQTSVRSRSGRPVTETPGNAARPTDSRSCAAWCPQC